MRCNKTPFRLAHTRRNQWYTRAFLPPRLSCYVFYQSRVVRAYFTRP